jgi:hypothetical protein
LSEKRFSLRWILTASVSLIVLALVGCGALNPSLIVVNNTGEDLCTVTASGGSNLLTEHLATGASATIDMKPGTYDLHAETCSGVITDMPAQVLESGAEFTWTLSLSNPTVKVVNNTGEEICVVQVSLSSASDAGENRLGDKTIAAGETFSVELDAAGTYDYHAETCSGVSVDNTNVEIGAGQESTWTLGAP